VQGLARKTDESAGAAMPQNLRVVGAIAYKRQACIRSLGTDLMFKPGFKPEAQLGDNTAAAGERVLGQDFVMGDRFPGF